MHTHTHTHTAGLPPIPPGDSTPFFANKDGYISRALSAVFGVISGLFTFLFLQFLFPDGGLLLPLGAVGITLLEWWLFRRAVLRNSPGAALMGCLVALISIAGSLGAYQGAFVRSVLDSEQYKANARQAEAWQSLTDPKKNPTGYLWAARKAEDAVAKLDAIQRQGVGSGSALFAGIADLTGADAETVALWVNMLIAAILEAVFIALIVWQAADEKRSYWASYASATKTTKGASATKDAGETAKTTATGAPYPTANKAPTNGKFTIGFHPPTPTRRARFVGGYNAARQRKKAQRLARVRQVLEQYPDLPATKQAELANISPATFRRLRAEMSAKAGA